MTGLTKGLIYALLISLISFCVVYTTVCVSEIIDDTSQYEYKVTIHEGLINTTVYYTNQSPMLGGNSVLLFDALTGLTVLEVAPRITVLQQHKPTPKPQ